MIYLKSSDPDIHITSAWSLKFLRKLSPTLLDKRNYSAPNALFWYNDHQQNQPCFCTASCASFLLIGRLWDLQIAMILLSHGTIWYICLFILKNNRLRRIAKHYLLFCAARGQRRQNLLLIHNTRGTACIDITPNTHIDNTCRHICALKHILHTPTLTHIHSVHHFNNLDRKTTDY
jgi:hypothetical protein